MADITGNPTPLNVPSPQDANGTLTPKAGGPATPVVAPSVPGVPSNVAHDVATSSSLAGVPSTVTHEVPPPVGAPGLPAPTATPDMPYTTPLPLLSIDITPADPTILNNGSQQFTATGNYPGGATQDLTAVVAWKSSNVNIATISAAGLAKGSNSNTGTVNITATLNGIVGTTTLTVAAV